MARKREGNIGVLSLDAILTAPPQENDSDKQLTDEEIQVMLKKARRIEILLQTLTILISLLLVAFNLLYAVSARHSLWNLLLFDLLSIYSSAFLTSYLTLIRDATFQSYFDPFNGLVYLAHFFDLFLALYLLAVVYDNQVPGEGVELGFESYLGLAAGMVKAVVLLVKKPKRIMVPKGNVDA